MKWQWLGITGVCYLFVRAGSWYCPHLPEPMMPTLGPGHLSAARSVAHDCYLCIQRFQANLHVQVVKLLQPSDDTIRTRSVPLSWRAPRGDLLSCCPPRLAACGRTHLLSLSQRLSKLTKGSNPLTLFIPFPPRKSSVHSLMYFAFCPPPTSSLHGSLNTTAISHQIHAPEEVF